MSDRLNIVQIQTALLIPITALFVENKLGVKPAEKEKRAVYWNASEYGTICDRLVHWVNTQRGVNAAALPGDRPKKGDEPTAAASDDTSFFGGDEPAKVEDKGGDFFGNEEEASVEGFF